MRAARAKRRGREKAPKRPRLPSVKELDRMCREYVFERDGHRCIRCGSAERIQWAHIYTRRYRTVRHHPWGSMTLCAGCHLWWHAEPLEAGEWIRKKWGDEKMDELMVARRRPKPPSPDETLAALA